MWNRFLFLARVTRNWLGVLALMVITTLFALNCSSDTPGDVRTGGTGSGGGGGSGGGSSTTSSTTSGSGDCSNGSTKCNGSCVNTNTDVSNCGGCGTVCSTGQTCNGSCQCQGGLTSCSNACTNTASDGKNCGGCGMACGGGTPYCSNSKCIATCPSGQMACGTGCVDASSFQTDPLNCGMCGKACSSGASCVAGSCGCATGSETCSGQCTDTQTSAANCGKCGMACPTGQTCTAGKCGGMMMTTTGGGGAGRPAGCPAAPSLLADFEEGTGTLVQQGGRTGWWYVFADMVSGGMQTPASSNMAIAAALLSPAGGDCNKYAMHSTAVKHTQYVGFGATLSPGATPALKKAVSLADYTGISFKIKSGSGTAPPIWFEFLNKETQPGAGCTDCGSGDLSGTAKNNSVDAFNTRGRLITGIGSDWKTFTVPFATLAPRYLPGECGAGVLCEAPGFNPESTLGLQFSDYSQFDMGGGQYDLWVDDVNLTTGDAGVPTLTQTAGANFPFPTDKALTNGCTKPTGASGKALIEAFQQWKSTFVTAAGSNLRVKFDDPSATVSEGIGYGMLIGVYMNDRALFDGLWGYWKANSSGGLMTWKIPGGSGSATDADEDTAFALIQASKQWGGSYLDDAKTLLSQIRSGDIEGGSILKPGNGFGGSALTNPSYFAPAFYRVFATVDTAGASVWNAVISSTYQYLKSIQGSNGLVPAWCTGSCSSRGGGGYADADKYQYDSHRTPWRIGLDACWNGNADAKAYVQKVAGFFAGASDTEGLGGLGDLYDSSGNKCTSCTQKAKANSMSLIGTAAVGAMASGSNKAFVDHAWRFLLDGAYTADPKFRSGSTSAYTYYNATVGLLTALTLSGNFNSF